MIAICVDDEPILLEWLTKMVTASPDINRVEKFLNENTALDYAITHPFDLAFLDIELHAMDGIGVAERLRTINPDCGIIFCTGHTSYAVDAIGRLRVDGYLLKPINSTAVQREIDRFKVRYQKSTPLLVVDFFGGISIFDKAGKPVHFKRRKTEQLFGVLVQHNGQGLSTRELCELLWTDSSKSRYLYKKNENYLSQLLTDLRHTLEVCGAQDVLKRTSEGYAVCMPLLELQNFDKNNT